MTTAPTEIHPSTGLRTGTFGIATLAASARTFPALVLADSRVIDLSERFSDTHAIFTDWDSSFVMLCDLADRATDDLPLLESFTVRPPLAHPNLLCAGANNRTHSAQMLTKNEFNQHNRLPGETDEEFFARNYAMMERRSREGTPFLWAGLHSSLAGAHDDIVLPPLGDQPDWELEIAAVIGRSARYATVEEATDLIAGYVIVNDLGTVDLFRRTDIPWGYDWIGKHQPTFKPTGPFVVPAAFIDIDESVRITLDLNGERMQDWRVDDWIFDLPTLVAYASERVNLMPGDLVLAGSPPGNGMHHGRFLEPGDTIEAAITYLGRQRNRVVAEDIGARSPAIGHWRND